MRNVCFGIIAHLRILLHGIFYRFVSIKRYCFIMSKRKQKARKNAKQRSEEINVHEALLYFEKNFDACGDDMSRDRVLSAVPKLAPPKPPNRGGGGAHKKGVP